MKKLLGIALGGSILLNVALVLRPAPVPAARGSSHTHSHTRVESLVRERETVTSPGERETVIVQNGRPADFEDLRREIRALRDEMAAQRIQGGHGGVTGAVFTGDAGVEQSAFDELQQQLQDFREGEGRDVYVDRTVATIARYLGVAGAEDAALRAVSVRVINELSESRKRVEAEYKAIESMSESDPEGYDVGVRKIEAESLERRKQAFRPLAEYLQRDGVRFAILRLNHESIFGSISDALEE